MRTPASHLRVVTVAVLLVVSSALPIYLLGALAVQLRRDLGVGDVALGWGFVVFFLTSAVLATISGRLTDRIGWRGALRLSSGCSGLTLVGIAILGRSYNTILLLLAIGGFGISIANPTTALALVREMPRNRLGTSFGIKQASIPVATFVAGLCVPLVALTIGWRWAFALAAVFPCITVLAVPSFVPTALRGESHKSSWRVTRPLLTLTFAASLATLSASSLGPFLVISAVDAGLTEKAAGLLLVSASMACIAVRVISGRLADATNSSGFPTVVAFLTIGAGGLAMVGTGLRFFLIPGALLAYGAGWGWPGLFQYAVAIRYRDTPASATGLLQVGLSGGAALGPLMFGFLARATSYSSAWIGSALVMQLSSLTLILAYRKLDLARVRETSISGAEGHEFDMPLLG